MFEQCRIDRGVLEKSRPRIGAKQEDRGAERRYGKGRAGKASPKSPRGKRNRNQDGQVRLEAEHSEEKTGQTGSPFDKNNTAAEQGGAELSILAGKRVHQR